MRQFLPWDSLPSASLNYIRNRSEICDSVETKEPKFTYLPIKCHPVISPKETFLRVHYFCNLQVGAVDVVVQVRQSLHEQTGRGGEVRACQHLGKCHHSSAQPWLALTGFPNLCKDGCTC